MTGPPGGPQSRQLGRGRTFVRSPTGLWRRTFDRVVVLCPGTDDCLVLGGTGTALWDCFDKVRSLKDVSDELAETFGADAALVHDDLAPVTEALLAKGVLVEAEER